MLKTLKDSPSRRIKTKVLQPLFLSPVHFGPLSSWLSGLKPHWFYFCFRKAFFVVVVVVCFLLSLGL